jgi:integrase
MSTNIEPPQIRVLGPYRFRDQYRCAIRNGSRKFYLAPEKTADRAAAVAERFVAELTANQPLTIGQAIERYGEHLQKKGNKPASFEGTPMRLRLFFAPALGQAVELMTERRSVDLYEKLRERPSERTGQPVAVATHQAYLADARSFGRWLVEMRHLKTNPLANIRGIGRRRKGKPQLRLDEARRWLRHAEELANQGEAGAVAAIVALLMGLRCSEIVSRVVRDLDDSGRLLWIPDSKTEAGKRTVKVPAILHPHLQRLACDKLPTAYLFPGKVGGEPDRAWPRKWVKRLCKLSRVPVVTAHSMRGLHATLAIEAGATPDVVARSLGHESASMTLSAYAAPGSAASANANRVHDLLAGNPR